MLVVVGPVLLAAALSWDVNVIRGAERFVLRVPENEPLLTAVERAGLLPGSDCRRGNCLSCAARVMRGSPFSLRVASDTALCEEAHSQALVLLCSSYATGPGLELRLGCEGEAWELQHMQRWRRDCPPPEPVGPAPTHFRMPEDAVALFERCCTSKQHTLRERGPDGRCIGSEAE